MASPRTHDESRLIDTQINVAQLLKQSVGATRRYALALEALDLGEGRAATTIEGEIKLTRIGQGILLTGAAAVSVILTCVRCLEEYTQPVALDLEEEYRPSIDIATGLSTPDARAEVAEEADYFLIGDDHVLDLAEALRQAIWLALPMAPRCREDCPGVTAGASEEPAASEEAAAPVDTRLAVLQDLLDASSESAATPARARRRRSSS